MTLSLNISPDVEAKLRERAAASGEPADVYASKVLAEAVTAPTIDELLAPVRQQVAASRMSEEELMGFGRELNGRG
jgi:hypothetical protein